MKEVHYGASAIREFVAHDLEGRFIRSIKKHLPVRSFIGTFVEDRPINLEDIIGLFLAEMRRRANQHFKMDVDSVVMGRPAKFSDNDGDDAYAQSRLEKAARMAGFKNIEFFAEPLAAAYGFRQTIQEAKTVIVVDLGGGTSDFTIIRITPASGQDLGEVLALGGVSVAGDALDGTVMRQRLSPHFGSQVTYQVPFGSNVLKMPVSLMEKICSPADISLLRKRDTLEFFKNVQQWSLGPDDRQKIDQLFNLLEDQLGFDVFECIEKSKRSLSDQAATEFHFKHPEFEIREEITRRQFDELTHDRVEQILSCLDNTLKAAQLSAKDIDLVCATGGTAKVPVIQSALNQRFGKNKVQEHRSFHSVVEGLSLRARELQK